MRVSSTAFVIMLSAGCGQSKLDVGVSGERYDPASVELEALIPNFTVNNDTFYAHDTVVKVKILSGIDEIESLQLGFYDGKDGDEFKESGCFFTDWQEADSSEFDFPLPDGQADGTKFICLKLKNMAKFSSKSGGRSIMLDTTAPEVSSLIDSVIHARSLGSSNELLLTGEASDKTSGLETVEVSVTSQKTGKCLNAAKAEFSEKCPFWVAADANGKSWSLGLNKSLLTSNESYSVDSRANDRAKTEASDHSGQSSNGLTKPTKGPISHRWQKRSWRHLLMRTPSAQSC